jgi:cell division protein FtsQ
VPVVAIRQAQGFLLIDGTGRWFLTAPTVPAGVVMTDIDPTDEPLLADIGQVAQALPKKLARKVDRITAMSPDSIRLVLNDGDTAVWGSAEDSSLKAEVLTALLKQSASTYDVSAPHYPAIR